MQKAKLDKLLQELYAWNPKLKHKEDELISLIELMAKAKPDTKFDEVFAESLKKDLLSHRILLDSDEGLKDNNFLFNLKSMNKKIYIAAGATAILVVAILMINLNALRQSKITNRIALVNNSGDQFVKTKPGSFGSLALLSSTNNVNAKVATSAVSSDKAVSAPANMVASSKVVSAPTNTIASPSRMAISSGVIAAKSTTVSSNSTIMSPRIIAPMHSYIYVYKGDALDLASSTTGTVYRRLKGDGNLSNNLDSLISSKSFGPINLSSFSNLQTNSISLVENKKLGLSINIDFNEENISISQNWSQWQSDRDKCGDNQACWDSYRIKINDIPDDASLIKMTNDFLAEKGINVDHYGAASVDNNWRANYEASTDKANYYIPEEVSVIYPLVVDGQTVYDQSGNLDGLRVTVNLLQKAVSGVSNLTSYRYETSDYALETDSSKILALAEKGGYGSGVYYMNGTQDKITLELGTPVKSLIHFWRYANNVNDELLIPALIFPINNAPADYYGSKFITVPLAQEMVNELSTNNSGGGYGGTITPMIK